MKPGDPAVVVRKNANVKAVRLVGAENGKAYWIENTKIFEGLIGKAVFSIDDIELLVTAVEAAAKMESARLRRKQHLLDGQDHRAVAAMHVRRAEALPTE